MRPEIEPQIRINIDHRISRTFPIRHVMIFDWRFDKAKNLDEVKLGLEKYHYLIEPDEQTIVFTAPVKPTVIMMFRQNDDNGGEFMLINMDKYYSASYDTIGTKFIEERAGIKLVS